MTFSVILAAYSNDMHAAAVLRLLGCYAERKLLPRLIGDLAARPGAFSLLALAGDDFVGLTNCFEGYSTFQARPLINIHDVFVDPAWRGRGVAGLLLDRVEAIACERGCCAITLEVVAHNTGAQAAYRRAGFVGDALFWKKKLA